MGRGDQKSRKGKIAIGSYGKLRPRKHKKNKPATPPPAVPAEKK
jgi:30S ribosomal protein S31